MDIRLPVNIANDYLNNSQKIGLIILYFVLIVGIILQILKIIDQLQISIVKNVLKNMNLNQKMVNWGKK